MKPVTEDCNATLVGAWNIAILNPQWLSQYLFENQRVKVEVPVGGTGLLRITGGRVRIHTSPARVQISPVDLVDDALLQVERVATTLLSELKHTPVSAVGVNFSYTEGDPAQDLLDHFQDPDADRLIDAGFRAEALTWTRHLKKDDDRVLNLSVRREPDNVRFSFNFHQDVGGTEAAVAALQDHVLEYQTTALGILERVFGLENEADDGEA